MAENDVRIVLTARDEMSGVLGRAQNSLASFGAHAEKIGKNLEGIGTRIGGIGVAGQAGLSRLGLDMNTLVASAVDAEKALYGIASTAGTSGAKAKAMVAEWTIAINQIARETNQQQASVTAAFGQMVAKGMDPRAAVELLKPIGKAATAAQADILNMATAMEAGFSKFGIPAAEAAKALDVLAQAGKRGAFEVKDMAGYFEGLTAQAESLGIKGMAGMGQLAAAAQISRRATGDAAMAANNLSNWLGKLNAETTFKNFEQAGADLGKLKEEAKASGDYIGYMVAAIGKITGGDSAKIAALFPDVEAGKFLQRMVIDLKDYKDIFTDSMAASGVAAADFDTQMQSTAATMEKLKIGATASAGEGGALKGILDALRGVAEWADQHPDLAKWLIFGTAGMAVGGAAIVGIGAMITAIVGIGAMITAIGGIGAMITAIGGIATALGGLAAFMAANPVVLTMLGLAASGAAGYALGNYLGLDEIGKKLGSFTYDVVQTLGKLPDDLAAMWERWKAAGAGLVQSLRDGISNALKGGLGIGDKLRDAVKYVTDIGGEWLKVGKDIMQGLLNGIQQKYKEIIAKIKGLGADMLDSVKDVLGIRSPSLEFEQIGLYVAEGMSLGISKGRLGVVRSVEDMARAAMDAGYAFDSLGDPLGDLAVEIEEIGKAAAKTEKSLAKMATAGKAQTFRDVRGKFLPSDAAERAAEEWRRTADDIQRSLTDALMRGFESGKDFARNFRDTLKNMFNSLVLRPIIQPIAQSAAGMITGALGMGASGTASASSGSATNALSLGSSLASAFSPGAISYAIGEGVAGLASVVGASTGVATGIGSMMSAAVPYIGAIMAAVALVKAFDQGGTPHMGNTQQFGLDGRANTVSTTEYMAGGGQTPSGLYGNLPGWLFGENGASPYDDAIAAFGQQMVSTINADMQRLGGTLGQDFALQFGFAAEAEAETTSGGFARVLLNGEPILDIYQRYAADGKAGIEAYMREVAPKVELVAIQAAAGLSPAIDALADAVDVSTASLGEISAALTRIGESGQALGLQAAFVQLNQSLGATDDQVISTGLALRGLSGNFDALQAGIATYYEAFFSEQERLAKTAASLGQSFAGLGVALPDSKAGFRALVESLDLTNTSGQQAFATLMQLAPTFAQVADAQAEAAKAAADAQAAATSSALSGLDSAMSEVARAIDAEKARVGVLRDIAAESVAGLAEVFTLLETQIDELYGSVASTAGMQAAQAQALIDAALGSGYLPNADELSGAIATLRAGLDTENFATRVDADRAALTLAGKLSALKSASVSQLSVAEQALMVAEDQLTALDAQLATAQAQLDAANGINTSILSVEAALHEFAAAIGQQVSARTAAGLPTSTAAAAGAYTSAAHATIAAYGEQNGGDAYYFMKGINDYAAKAESVAQIAAMTSQTIEQAWQSTGASAEYWQQIQAMWDSGLKPTTRSLPMFEAGTNFVPNDMLAGIHAGERIIPAAENRELMARLSSPQANDAALIAEIKALREEVVMLRAETRAVVTHTGKTSRQLDAVINGGEAFTTVAAA